MRQGTQRAGVAMASRRPVNAVGGKSVTVTSESTRSAGTTGKSYLLISGDSHINEPANLFTDRMPKKFGDRIPHVERLEQGDGWYFDGVEGALPFGLNCCAGQEPRLRQAWVTYEEVRPGGWDPAARIEEISKAGVDAEVLYPTPRFSAAMFAQTDPELHLAMVRAYNDWLSEYAE